MRSFAQTRTKLLEDATDKAFSLDEADRDHLSKFDDREKAAYPSDRKIPVVLILKRKAIRVYPDHQKVALYYAQNIDKYVTIPFGTDDTGIATVKEAASVPSVKSANVGGPWTTATKSITPPDYHQLHKDYLDHLSKTVRDPDDHDVDSAAMAALHADRANRILHKIKTYHPGEKAIASYTAGRQHVSNLEAQKKKEHAGSAKVLLHPSNFSGDVVRDAGYLTGTAVRLLGRGIKNMVKRSIRESFFDNLNLNEDDAPTVPAAQANQEILKRRATRDALRKKIVKDRDLIQQKAEEGDIEGAEKHARENPAVIPNKEVNNALDQASGERTEKTISNLETVAPYAIGGIGAVGVGLGVRAAVRGLATRRAAKLAGGAAATTAAGVGGRGILRRLGSSILGSGQSSPNNNNPPQQPKDRYDFNLKAKSSTPQKAVDYQVRGGADSARGWKAFTGGQQQMRENFDVIKRVVRDKELTETLHFDNKDSLNINSNIAKKIVKLYGLLDESNKIKMKSMLNESADTFKTVVNFTKRI